jgi:hypothetical protein
MDLSKIKGKKIHKKLIMFQREKAKYMKLNKYNLPEDELAILFWNDTVAEEVWQYLEENILFNQEEYIGNKTCCFCIKNDEECSTCEYSIIRNKNCYSKKSYFYKNLANSKKSLVSNDILCTWIHKINKKYPIKEDI